MRVSPQFLPYLPQYFGEPIRAQIARAGPPDREGWMVLTLPFETLEDARDRILSFGGAVEVLTPPAVRNSILAYAAHTVALYTRPRRPEPIGKAGEATI